MAAYNSVVYTDGPDIDIVRPWVFPVDGLIGPKPWLGKCPTEETLSEALAGPGDGVLEGFAPPAVGAAAGPQILHYATGKARIGGRIVWLNTGGQWFCALPYKAESLYDGWNMVALKLVTASGRVVNAGLEVRSPAPLLAPDPPHNPTGPGPKEALLPATALSLPLWLVLVNASGVIASVQDFRRTGQRVEGAIVPNPSDAILNVGTGNWSYTRGFAECRIDFDRPFYRLPTVVVGDQVTEVHEDHLLVSNSTLPVVFKLED